MVVKKLNWLKANMVCEKESTARCFSLHGLLLTGLFFVVVGIWLGEIKHPFFSLASLWCVSACVWVHDLDTIDMALLTK